MVFLLLFVLQGLPLIVAASSEGSELLQTMSGYGRGRFRASLALVRARSGRTGSRLSVLWRRARYGRIAHARPKTQQGGQPRRGNSHGAARPAQSSSPCSALRTSRRRSINARNAVCVRQRSSTAASSPWPFPFVLTDGLEDDRAVPWPRQLDLELALLCRLPDGGAHARSRGSEVLALGDLPDVTVQPVLPRVPGALRVRETVRVELSC